MKKINCIVLVFALLSLLFSCKKETSSSLPTIKDATIGYITAQTAMSQSEVTSDGGSTILSRGVCYSTVSKPTLNDSITSDGKGIGTFVSNLKNLLPNTHYYLRSYARNSAGVAYGNEATFITLVLTVTDVDGNVYNTVAIGTQIWMSENLKTTKYSNGDPIPNVYDTAAWRLLSSGAYCNYNNDAIYGAKFGRLYNWLAVKDDRKIAPAGWHVPSDNEWNTLKNNTGGDVAGGNLKATGTQYWQSPNTGATNQSGFSALPVGSRAGSIYCVANENAFWWSSTPYYTWLHELCLNAFCVFYNDSGLGGTGPDKTNGFSIRCIKD